MSATRDLIAAALRLTALAERNTDDRDEWQHSISEVREMCARAMVQPDMAEVEKRLCIHENVVRMHANGAEFDKAPSATRAALLDYVRGHFVDADKMVSAAEVPMPEVHDYGYELHGEGWVEVLACNEDEVRTYGDAREAAGYARGVRDIADCRTCANAMAGGCGLIAECINGDHYKATAPHMYWAIQRGEVK